MTSMTSTLSSGRWASDLHPRTPDGRFGSKDPSAPEATLITGVPWHLRNNLEPTSEADNPLLVEYLTAQTENGDSAERWEEAINAYFDGDENPRDDDGVYSTVREAIGTPRDEDDVAHWTARTAAWRKHALDVLATETD